MRSPQDVRPLRARALLQERASDEASASLVMLFSPPSTSSHPTLYLSRWAITRLPGVSGIPYHMVPGRIPILLGP
ncbi:MAG TPA: hypothetical protein VFO16_17370 [Pseudonocardiaceae bacterium]|nr:hypothetical protein [Pseudonocardiaceae bacterium]